jgi:hypothetical protein
MRIFSAALVAAFFAAGTVAAYAETAPAPAKAAAPAKVKCKKLAEAACVAPDCTWTPGVGSAKGKCTKAKKAK